MFYILLQNLSNNKLTSLPTSLGNLRSLKTLNVSNNQIAELPYTIGLLKSVRMLDATHNSLKEVPEEIGDMASLEQLYLRHNQITKLPVMRSCSTLKVGNKERFIIFLLEDLLKRILCAVKGAIELLGIVLARFMNCLVFWSGSHI